MKEKEEKGIMEDGEGASKRDFLKVPGGRHWESQASAQ